LLLLVSFALCLPSFYVINTLAGLRADFPEALRAVVATQACVAIVLASLAPVTVVSYVSMTDYQMAWVLRPFVGNPDLPVTFFREEQWGNAYVEVVQTLLRSLRPSITQ